jgi:hypothetical protein
MNYCYLQAILVQRIYGINEFVLARQQDNSMCCQLITIRCY